MPFDLLNVKYLSFQKLEVGNIIKGDFDLMPSNTRARFPNVNTNTYFSLNYYMHIVAGRMRVNQLLCELSEL